MKHLTSELEQFRTPGTTTPGLFGEGRIRPRWLSGLVLAGLLLGTGYCDHPSHDKRQAALGGPGTGGASVAFQPLAGAPRFKDPIFLDSPPGSAGELWVVEQAGRIYSIGLTGQGKTAANKKRLRLDIRSRVSRAGSEMGLLGMAFHPRFAVNGRVFLNYTRSGPRRTVVREYRLAKNGQLTAGPLLLQFKQPWSNHNGGMLAFDRAGKLLIGTGDGGSGGDPLNAGQDLTTWLGKILRVDVDKKSNGKNYGIPADNPFTPGNMPSYVKPADRAKIRPEIYAFGLRNPWRFSVDPVTGAIWAGDVGQNKYEEISLIVAGGNYGWKLREGRHCYSPATNCRQSGLRAPLLEYSHKLGQSVTGGLVYRGSEIPGLNGTYFYGDFGSGRVWTWHPDHRNKLFHASDWNISSFGADGSGELYLLDYYKGRIYRLGKTN